MRAQATLEPITDPLLSRLAEAIASVRAENDRLANLLNGQERAHSQLMAAEAALRDAESALRRATAEEPQRLANAFVNGTTDETPVGDAQLIVTAAQAEVDRLARVEPALEGEIERSRQTLQVLRTTQWSIMASIVTASEEYRLLVEQHKDAWRTLCSVKEALRAVTAGLHGALEQRWMDESSRSEPLDKRVGFPVDDEFVNSWRDAIAQLEQDADVELPIFG